MKKLYIIRHAKSSWKDFTLDDFDRPLNKRGKHDAPLMGNFLKENNICPDTIISSPALRAKTTAKLIAKEINFTNEIIFNQNIYEANVLTLQNILLSLDNKHNIVFLFGHNPSLNMLAENLVNFNENISTCGIVQIDFMCDDWDKINSSNATFISFNYPKSFYQ